LTNGAAVSALIAQLAVPTHRVDEAELGQETRRRDREQVIDDQGNSAGDQHRVAGERVLAPAPEVHPEPHRRDQRKLKPVDEVEQLDQELATTQHRLHLEFPEEAKLAFQVDYLEAAI
jgi:hypothetical protein